MKPLPVTLAADMVRLDPPVLETVSVLLWLLPTGTLPRFKLDGAPRCPAAPVSFPEREAVALPE